MVAKQKVAFIVAIVVSFSAIATTVFTPSQAFADYTVESGQKCDDGKDPVRQKNGTDVVYNCTGERTTQQQTNNGTGTKDTDPGSTDDTVTCAIEKMGWILCPVIETASKVGDKAFALLANNFLQTEPELVSQGSGTKTAWGLALNLANLMFIAVFIIIILSQVTGRGINNYGIKKLLPRLIIGAILVNVSYYVCQLMVDLSNILGFELKNFLVDTARSVSSSSVFPQQTSIDNQTSNGTLGLIATGILATAAIVWFLLPVLFLGVSTVVITCLVVIAILLLRKALIILLVVLSPIAFVAYLLPNTEGYFQKWLKMFWQLLMVFPIVGMLFGAGQLASAIILVAGTNSSQVQSTNSTATTTKTDSSYDDPGTKSGGKCIQLPKGSVEGRLGKCTGGSTPFMLGLVAAGVAVAPLLAVWAVLKGALSAAGAIGGKIAGAVQSAGDKSQQRAKAVEDGLRKAASQKYQTRALNGGWVPGAGALRMNQRRKLNQQKREAELEAAQASFGLTGKANSITQATMAAKSAVNQANQIQQAQFIGSGGLSSAASLLNAGNNPNAKDVFAQQATKELAEAIKNAELGIDTKDMDNLGQRMAEANRAGDQVTAKAIANVLLRTGSKGQEQFHKGIQTIYAGGGSYGSADNLQNFVRNNHGDIKSADASIAAWANSDGANSLADFQSGAVGDAWGKMTAADFAGSSAQAQAKAAAHLSTQTIADLKKAQNSQLLAKVGKDARGVLGF